MSIFIGLVFFLICATVGTIVMNAAQMNAGRLTNMRIEQDSYLALKSALEVVRKDLAGVSIVGTVETITSTPGYTSTETITPTPKFVQLLKDHTYAATNNATPLPPAELAFSANGVEDVVCYFSMDENLNIKVVAYLASDTQKKYALTLMIPCVSERQVDIGRVEVPYDTGETYTAGGVTRPIYGLRTETKTITSISASWYYGTIYGGAA